MWGEWKDAAERSREKVVDLEVQLKNEKGASRELVKAHYDATKDCADLVVERDKAQGQRNILYSMIENLLSDAGSHICPATALMECRVCIAIKATKSKLETEFNTPHAKDLHQESEQKDPSPPAEG